MHTHVELSRLITRSASAFGVCATVSPAGDALPHVVKAHQPTASSWSLSAGKRMLDIIVAVPVLLASSIPMLLIAFCVRVTSEGPALFVQERMGRGGCLFRLYKFRTMTLSTGAGLTMHGDRRITGLGRWLRAFKLDEIPQFYNVLRGEMSLVGPRPKLPRYAAIRNMPYRPGITGPATLAFRREEEILGGVHPSQLEHFYNRRIKPLKARLDLRYMKRATFWSDLRLVAATLVACVVPARIPATLRDRSAESPVLLSATVLDTPGESSAGAD